jgi:Neuraminidase (sialidase)
MFEVKPSPTPEVVVTDDSYVEVVNDEYYNAFPGLARLDDGTLITVYRKGVLHVRDRGYIVARRSMDGGETWSDEMTVADNPGLDVRDPNIALLSDGALIVNYFQYDHELPGTVRNGLRVVHSFDGGETWDEPVAVGTGSFVATSAPVLQLPNGDVLLAYYGSHEGSRYATAYVNRSDDGGKWWLGETVIASGPAAKRPFQEPNLLLLENGDILATIRSDGERPIIHTSVSKDQGETWSEPQVAFKGSGTPSVTRLASGGIVMIYRSKIGRNFGLPALRVSRDGGETWTEDLGETVIDRKDGDMMYASALQVPDGRIAVVYGMEDGRRRSEIRFRYLSDLRE